MVSGMAGNDFHSHEIGNPCTRPMEKASEEKYNE
jgi:hypothetical protein